MSDPNQFDPTPSQPAPSGLSDNAAGALAYVTIIPAIIFLLVEPYSKSSYVRFHSWQSIFLTIGAVCIDILFMILRMLPFIGLLFGFLFVLVWVGLFILWLVVVINAFNGKRFSIPFIGDLAAKQAGA